MAICVQCFEETAVGPYCPHCNRLRIQLTGQQQIATSVVQNSSHNVERDTLAALDRENEEREQLAIRLDNEREIADSNRRTSKEQHLNEIKMRLIDAIILLDENKKRAEKTINVLLNGSDIKNNLKYFWEEITSSDDVMRLYYKSFIINTLGLKNNEVENDEQVYEAFNKACANGPLHGWDLADITTKLRETSNHTATIAFARRALYEMDKEYYFDVDWSFALSALIEASLHDQKEASLTISYILKFLKDTSITNWDFLEHSILGSLMRLYVAIGKPEKALDVCKNRKYASISDMEDQAKFYPEIAQIELRLCIFFA